MSYLLCTLIVVLNPADQPPQEPAGVCSLIAATEIAEAQGATVKETKASAPDRKGNTAEQCFYVVEPFERSVSLEVTRPDPRQPASAAPREQWNRLFHPASNGTAPAKNAFSSPGKKKNARPIEGLGDEAFWIGDGQVGALYVLKGEVYFRLSVGGWTDETIRLQKSKELAEKVLKRL